MAIPEESAIEKRIKERLEEFKKMTTSIGETTPMLFKELSDRFGISTEFVSDHLLDIGTTYKNKRFKKPLNETFTQLYWILFRVYYLGVAIRLLKDSSWISEMPENSVPALQELFLGTFNNSPPEDKLFVELEYLSQFAPEIFDMFIGLLEK